MSMTFDELLKHEEYAYGGWADSNTQGINTQIVFDTYDMSYSKRTITLNYKACAYLGSQVGTYRVYSNYAVKLYPAYKNASGVYTIYDEITLFTTDLTFEDNTIERYFEGKVVIPYHKDSDELRFYWGASGVRLGTTYTCGTYYGVTDFTLTPSLKFRNLVNYPFYLDFPEEQFGYNTTLFKDENRISGIYNTTVGTYTIIVPLSSYPQYTIRLQDKYDANIFYQHIMTSPNEGRYEVEFKIDATGAQALRAAMLSTGTTKDYYLANLVEIYPTTRNTKIVPIIISSTTPVVSGTVIDVNDVAINVSGNAKTLVRWLSHIKASITVEAQGGATIVEYGIVNGEDTRKNINSTVFAPSGSEVFQFYATDDRGETGYATITMPVIEYLQPTAKVNTGVITGEGEAVVTVRGVYFANNIKNTANTIAVAYRYKLNGAEDSEYTSWLPLTDIEVDAETNTYVASGYATGLNYNKTYEFQAKIVDVFYTVLSAVYIAVSKPVFDWSATDFNFNVPVTIMGKTYDGKSDDGATAKVLWSGYEAMGANTTIQLSENISKQKNGIVLVFSYNGATMEQSDIGWNTFYVPKIMVELYNGGGQTFIMALSSNLSAFGAKHLYINDSNIVGETSNTTANATNSSINYSNAIFCLRYVIGV